MDVTESLDHTRRECKHHAVWLPKCRREVLYGRLRQHLCEVPQVLAQHNECTTVLLLADLFHPLDDFTVERFLNADMRHTRGGRGAVPVLPTRRDPDHITSPDFPDLTA